MYTKLLTELYDKSLTKNVIINKTKTKTSDSSFRFLSFLFTAMS